MDDRRTESPASMSLGVALILVALVFLVSAPGIRYSGLTGENDPGPRAIPNVLSLGLMLFGLVEIARCAWRSARPVGRVEKGATKDVGRGAADAADARAKAGAPGPRTVAVSCDAISIV